MSTQALGDTVAGRATRVVIFDLGGVLIDLRSADFLASLEAPLSPEAWRRWMLTAPVARRWERGACSAQEFARGARRDLDLPDLDDATFLDAFTRWVAGPYPESRGLLAALRPDLVLACLSNCNALHWRRLCGLGVDTWFAHRFLSHELHLAKPDLQVYREVQAHVGCAAGSLLFLDDNEVNVHAARELGWQAEVVRGPGEARACLASRGLLRTD